MNHETIVIPDSSLDRYASSKLIRWWNQDCLTHASAMVVGAGALGNEVLKCMALLGFGRIVIVDFDCIEMSNLGRSVLYRQTDAGKRKCEVAAARVRELNPDVRVVSIQSDVADLGLGVFRHMDVVLGCLDNREARCAVNRGCWRVGAPYVDGALDGLSGSVKVFLPPKGACYECGLTEPERRWLAVRNSCPVDLEYGRVPTTITSASVIAAVQVQEALKLLHGRSVGGFGFLYSGDACVGEKITMSRRASCMAHDAYGPVIELDAAAEQLTVAGLLGEACARLGPGAVLVLDRQVVSRLACPACGAQETGLAAYRGEAPGASLCGQCGGPMLVELTYLIDDAAPGLGAPLARLGVPPLHILEACRGEESIYFELSGDLPNLLAWETALVTERGFA
jgi:adenylyltransferase/sulfurtransferase